MKLLFNKIKRVRRRAVRFVKSRYSRYSSVSDMLDVLGWTPLSQRRQEARLILFYKIINGLAQVPSEGVLVKAYKFTRRKHNIKFRQIGHTTSQYGQSFFPKTISAWNGLAFAEAPSLAVFRSNFIRNYLASLPHNALEGFCGILNHNQNCNLVSNSFDPLSDTNLTFEIDSFSSTTPFVPRIHSTPILNSPITLEPPVQNMTSTSTQTNPPPAFSISSSGPESPPSVLIPELSSDFIYSKKGSNWRIVVINANSITHKKAEISAMADYCDPDLMLITETKLDSSIFSSELLPNGYVGEFRWARNLNGGGVMIVTKDCYTITDLVLQTTPQNETELVWAAITLKDHS